ncbi:MAG: DinB family protein [Bacteroidota bacterium]
MSGLHAAAARPLEQIRQTRRFLDTLTSRLGDDALVQVPDGFSNNVLWNVGHVVVTLELLTYGLAGLDLGVPASMVAAFRKGTSPADWDETPDPEAVRHYLHASPDRIEADLRDGRFEAFREYKTTPGVVLASVDDAISFDLYHEGLHLGAVLALRKLVA